MTDATDNTGPRPLDPAAMRVDYDTGTLRRADLPADPLTLFTAWLALARDSGMEEPNAMALATVSPDGQPSCRTVLCKGLDPDRAAIEFFTNLESRKGQELEANPSAAATFFWAPTYRQVCIRGHTERLPREAAEAYFRTRPYENQIGALASAQSAPLRSRADLESRADALRLAHPEGSPIPMPAHWGGFRLVGQEWEFWQGRTSRLHDRFLYRRSPENASWEAVRLNP